MSVIERSSADLRVAPNLVDYDRTRAEFDWGDVPDPCAGMPEGGCNIAYAAVDRHADGRLASRTALRFVPASAWDGAMATRDLSYGELGRLSRRFTNVLRSLGINKGDRVFTLLGHCPELYITVMGSLRNGSVVCPLFSAFGPEPVATRISLGEAQVLVTTAAIYHRKIAAIRNRLSSLRNIVIIDDDVSNDESRGTLNFWHWMDADDENAPIELTTADDPALLHFTSGTTGTPKGALHVHGAVTMHYLTACTHSTSIPRMCSGAPPTPAGSPAPPTASSPRW
jgi:acetyl-CoA synthetase